MQLAANFTGGHIASSCVGWIDAIIGMDIDVGIATLDQIQQGAEGLACQRTGQIGGGYFSLGEQTIVLTAAGGAGKQTDYHRTIFTRSAHVNMGGDRVIDAHGTEQEAHRFLLYAHYPGLD